MGKRGDTRGADRPTAARAHARPINLPPLTLPCRLNSDCEAILLTSACCQRGRGRRRAASVCAPGMRANARALPPRNPSWDDFAVVEEDAPLAPQPSAERSRSAASGTGDVTSLALSATAALSDASDELKAAEAEVRLREDRLRFVADFVADPHEPKVE